MEKGIVRRAATGIRELLEGTAPEPEKIGEASLADLHMHSQASDGTDTPRGLLERAGNRGVCVAGLTDHDTIAGVEALNAGVPEGVFFVPGIEFSCKDEGGKCHILGYACDTAHPQFRAVLERGQSLRRQKLDRRLAFLEEEVGIRFPREEVDHLYDMVGAGQSVGKPHLGNLLVKYGLATDRNQAIREIVNRCPTEDARVEAAMAVSAIRTSGGISVWAHPMGGEGEKRIGWDAFLRLLGILMDYGLRGLECFYSRFPLELCERLAEEARARGLWISGGSDCHGTNKPILAGTLNAEGIPVSPKRLSILPALADRLQTLGER